MVETKVGIGLMVDKSHRKATKRLGHNSIEGWRKPIIPALHNNNHVPQVQWQNTRYKLREGIMATEKHQGQGSINSGITVFGD